MEVFMTEREAYTISSLELHLFFLRIMKEHAFFLSAGSTPVNADFSRGALRFKQQFETLLSRAINLGNGIVRPEILKSCEIVTGCTLTAEQQTETLTGIPINKKLTHMEESMNASCSPNVTIELSHHVKQLNQQTLILLNGFLRFQESIAEHVQSCRMFTSNYPTLIDHILREAIYYRDSLMALDNENCNQNMNHKADETFWNRIMMEHALFMRGLLDPAENKLIVQANTFAETYAELLDMAAEKVCDCEEAATEPLDTLAETEKFRDFKQTATIGLTECEIRSIILPLLSDHILREANHYLRLLRMQNCN